MDAQDFRRIQEAYREVYQELDEADDLESLQKDTQSSVDKMKKGNRITRAGAHIAAHKVERDVKKASAYGPQRPKAGQTGAYRIGEEVGIDEEKWIQKAIKKPGSLHKQLGVPAGEKIPAKELAAAAKKGGKLGRRARLAQTLKSLHKEEIEQLDEISADTALRASKEATKRAGTYAALSGGERKPTEKAAKLRAQAERLYAASARKRLKAKTTTVKITREEYDFILSHLIDEGYTNTFDGARVIASNMSDDWIVSILDEGKVSWDNPRSPLESGLTPREKNRAKRKSIEDKESPRYKKLQAAQDTQKGTKVSANKRHSFEKSIDDQTQGQYRRMTGDHKHYMPGKERIKHYKTSLAEPKD